MPFTLLSSNAISGGVGDSLRPNAKPLIINGNMAVAQRGTSTASITDDGYHTIDRFKLLLDTLGTWTQTQESLTSGDAYTDGFANALKMDCTTADGSPAAGDRMFLFQRLEGQDLQMIKKGTANAEKLTLSFWVKATKTGTNICELGDNDNSRKISQSYTISSSDTWEKKVINFAADTTGVFGDDNGASLDVVWWLGAGTNYTSGTLNSSWNGSVANANRAVGQVNHADSTSNNFHITGVQLEVGEYTSSTLPDFQHESYQENLARCHRYCYVVGSAANSGQNGFHSWIGGGLVRASGSARFCDMIGFYPQMMRTTPTFTLHAGALSNINAYTNDGYTRNPTATPSISNGVMGYNFTCNMGTSSSLTQGDATVMYKEDVCQLQFSSEL